VVVILVPLIAIMMSPPVVTDDPSTSVCVVPPRRPALRALAMTTVCTMFIFPVYRDNSLGTYVSGCRVPSVSDKVRFSSFLTTTILIVWLGEVDSSK
jgi:hypothetical protein